jgi:thymidylate synthase
MLAVISGYKVGTVTGFLADCHLYENHLEQAKELIGRNTFDLPTLSIYYDENRVGVDISKFEPSDFSFGDTYHSGLPLKALMAV